MGRTTFCQQTGKAKLIHITSENEVIEAPMGKTMYHLLEESATLRNPKLEAMVVEILNSSTFWDSDKKANSIARSIVEGFSDINCQGLSGRTIMMLIADVSLYRSISYSTQREEIESNFSNANNIVFKICAILIDNRANPNLKDNSGCNLLHVAAANVNATLCTFIFPLIKNPQEKNSRGDSPLHALITFCSMPLDRKESVSSTVPKSFLQLAPNDLESSWSSLLAKPSWPELLGWPSMAPRPYVTTLAAKLDAAKLAARLYAKQCDHNDTSIAEDSSSYSGGQRSIAREVICRLWTESGLSCSEEGSHGNTILHKAAATGDTRITVLLLRKCVKKNMLNSYKQTPLHLACIENQREVVTFLMHYKAECTIADVFGNLPVHYACMRNNNVATLFDSHLLLQAPLNNAGWNLLHLACYFNNNKLVQYLLHHKVNINTRNKHTGKTAFMIVCEKGHVDLCQLLLSQQSLRWADKENSVGSALDWACEFEQYDICKILANYGCLKGLDPRNKATLLRRTYQNDDTELRGLFFEVWQNSWGDCDQDGKTIVDIALSENYKDVLEGLRTNFNLIPTSSKST